jgi:prepilin-type N-terminal cleavage/methylation domain-containing protein
MLTSPLPCSRLGDRCFRGRGFTLVEALATMLIMAIVLPIAMRTITISNSMASFAMQRTQAITLCESKLNELLATGEWNGGVMEGDFGTDAALAVSGTQVDPDLANYKWAAEVVPWNDSRVEQLNVTVTWERNGENRHVTLSTLVQVEQQ